MRTWTSQPLIAQVGSAQGAGWSVSDWPYLIQGTSTVIAVLGGNVLYFDRSASGTYTARYFAPDTLVQNSSTGGYTLTDSLGDQFNFNSFTISNPSNVSQGMYSRGGLASYTDADNQTAMVASTDIYGNITEIDRGSDVFTYTYTANPTNYQGQPNQAAPENLTQLQITRSGTLIAQVTYAYYQSGGNIGDLELVDVQTLAQPGATTLTQTSGSYYQYQNGQLTYAAEGNDFLLLLNISGGAMASASQEASAFNTSAGGNIAGYATEAFTYYTNGQVKSQTIVGAGSSTNPEGTYTYAYYPNSDANPFGLNDWKYKTIVTRPDNSTDTEYFNFAGELLLTQLQSVPQPNANQNPAPVPSYVTFYNYDTSGRLAMIALPSATTPAEEGSFPREGESLDSIPDLLGSNGDGTFQGLNEDQGLVDYYFYYGPATTAPGYLESTSVGEGADLTSPLPTLESFYTYTTPVTLPGITLHPVTSYTVFPNVEHGFDVTPSGDPAERTTNYGYNYSGAHITSITTTLPTVTTAQHGSGATTRSTQTFDSYGYPTGGTDATGTPFSTTYNSTTGTLSNSVDGANDSSGVITQDYYGRPAGDLPDNQLPGTTLHLSELSPIKLPTVVVPPPDLRRFDQLLTYHDRGQSPSDQFTSKENDHVRDVIEAQPQDAATADDAVGVCTALA